jgi:HAD superfamily hydrolase (TIGR01549 family)
LSINGGFVEGVDPLDRLRHETSILYLKIIGMLFVCMEEDILRSEYDSSKFGKAVRGKYSLALVFDLDGTVIDSEAIKKEAFSSLFKHLPEYETIRHYNETHRGIPRAVKLEHIFENVLKNSKITQDVQSYLEKYAQALVTSLNKAPLVPGFLDFASNSPVDKFIASSAPRAEIKEHLERLEIHQLFQDYFGYPKSKVEVLKLLKQRYSRLIFIGDALADYEAAQAVNINFIGIRQSDTTIFQHLTIPIISHYTELEKVLSEQYS